VIAARTLPPGVRNQRRCSSKFERVGLGGLLQDIQPLYRAVSWEAVMKSTAQYCEWLLRRHVARADPKFCSEPRTAARAPYIDRFYGYF
jgi:hypothetical protein